MSIGNPPLSSNLPIITAPIGGAKFATWPKPWGNWISALFGCIAGWNKTYTNSAVFDFGNITTLSTATTTVTVTGARSGDAVHVSSGTPTTGIIIDGYVSASDTVTIRAQNFTAGTINPASSTFRVIVFQQ